MTKVINSVLILSLWLGAHDSVESLDCKLQIDIAQVQATEIILTLSYDEKCEVIMDENSSQIKLISIVHDSFDMILLTGWKNNAASGSKKIAKTFRTIITMGD